MKRFLPRVAGFLPAGILLLFVLTGIASPHDGLPTGANDVTTNDLYAIYGHINGEIFFDTYWDEFMDKDDLAFTFHFDKGSKWVGLGYSKGNKITLFDLKDLDSEEDEDEEAEKFLTLTCSDPDENGNFLTITVKGSKALGNRFDGIYKAHQGHV